MGKWARESRLWPVGSWDRRQRPVEWLSWLSASAVQPSPEARPAGRGFPVAGDPGYSILKPGRLHPVQSHSAPARDDFQPGCGAARSNYLPNRSNSPQRHASLPRMSECPMDFPLRGVSLPPKPKRTKQKQTCLSMQTICDASENYVRMAKKNEGVVFIRPPAQHPLPNADFPHGQGRIQHHGSMDTLPWPGWAPGSDIAMHLSRRGTRVLASAASAVNMDQLSRDAHTVLSVAENFCWHCLPISSFDESRKTSFFNHIIPSTLQLLSATVSLTITLEASRTTSTVAL
ncbi:hypothetical protein B0J13DRAFT_522864 [Dactylonectria estremocensis]|uniref:Uncharacterized protein n=1 Tax=Dactylonectria estremocensis TaxID=1079267 RepID=A0A9P9J689_9HYPO|nr:hypothetical protein B0J13DRAFT_522864 [Dactylonectria estremocensis]